jgi:hypothetical protein
MNESTRWRWKLHPEAQAVPIKDPGPQWDKYVPAPSYPPPHCECGHARDYHDFETTSCDQCECDHYHP